jgi:flagellar M-ring protein FliF
VPGALTNQPPTTSTPSTAATKDAAGANTSVRKESTVNYEIDKTVKHTRAQVGTVKRLSAAVLVNHKRPLPTAAPAADAKAADAKDAKPAAAAAPVAFTESELAQMNALVKDAIGFSKERGDSLNLVNAPFSTEPETLLAETPIWQNPGAVSIAKESGKAAFLLLALALVVMGVLRPAMRQISASMETREHDVTPPQAAIGMEAPLTALPGTAPSAHLAEVQRIAREDPATVANVVRSWVQK